jgi:tRNA1(Val) A37 N6-methylase TrmN6
MSEDAGLCSLVKQVGDDVHSELSADSAVVSEAHNWLYSNGVDRADNPTKVFADLAAYDRFLKTTLYALYRIDGSELPGISEPGQISDRLRMAKEVTGDAAFERYILDEVADSVDQEVFAPLLDSRHRLADTGEPTEFIGQVFEQVVPQVARRKLGQFRTPRYIADAMAGWTVRESVDTVLDPGMGSGVLTARSYAAKKAVGSGASVEDMWGVDLSELSVVMTSTALKLVNGEGAPNLHRGDFMNTVAEGEPSRLVQKGPETLPKVDAVISNPPYSRHHELSEEDKHRVNEIAKAEASMPISKRAPMYHYFYVHATQFLSEKGRMAFVTPSEWLETNYGESLKEFLLTHFQIQGLVMYDTDIDVFDGARTTLCIAFLEKSGSSGCETSFLRISEWPGQDKILKAVSGEIVGETEWGVVNHVSQSKLLPSTKWTQFVDEDSVDSIPGLKTLGEIAEVKRGIATGNNDYFCLSEAEVEEYDLPKDCLVRLVRRLGGLQYYDLRDTDWNGWRDGGDAVYLLYLYDEEGEIIKEVDEPSVEDYLEFGQQSGAADGFLTQRRNPWYRVDKRDPAPVLFTYMAKRGGLRFLENRAGLRTLNNLHNIYFKKEYTEREIRAILAYLNSEVSNEIVARSGRSYADNLQKVEPNELESVPVIDPDELSMDEVATLSRYFVDLAEVARSDDISLEQAQAELDEKVAEILGIDRTRE